ncbi:MAG TPA: SDR family NAD(P)-dependent oxidoreductase [Puia sp.]|nr:SDR family NAD(P)-dependent oxidoreductase [Puia sp.]
MKKVVLITGASAGIGEVMAKHLADNGFRVYGAARRTEKLKELEAFGIQALSMDVTDESSMAAGVGAILAREGQIDVLINNAGFGSYGAIEEGRIINISSIGGKVSMPLGGWYHASKFALEAMSDALRNEVRQFGIDVVVIEPGGVKSEWADIAVGHGLRNSGKGIYQTMATKFAGLQESYGHRSSNPLVIARIVLKAIRSGRPRTRYAAGFMAGPVLTMRKLLPDRWMDRLLLSQLQ